MKKIVLFILFAVVSSCIYAQFAPTPLIISRLSEDTLLVTQYDTVLIYRNNEFKQDSSAWDCRVFVPGVALANGTLEEYHCEARRSVYSPVPYYDSAWGCTFFYPTLSFGGTWFGRNSYTPEAFGQHFHFDSMVTVIGVAAQVRGQVYGLNPQFYITSEKHNFEKLSAAYAYPSNMQSDSITWRNLGFYMFPDAVTVNDFIIVGELFVNPADTGMRYGNTVGNATSNIEYNANFSVYDTLMKDTLIGPQSSNTPWLKKNGQWKRFNEDSIYHFVQGTTLNFRPIIVLNTSLLNGINEIAGLENKCDIYPNPARDEVFVKSNYQIKLVELFDVLGRLQKREEFFENEIVLDLKHLNAGNYIIKVYTDKGVTQEKILVLDN